MEKTMSTLAVTVQQQRDPLPLTHGLRRDHGAGGVIHQDYRRQTVQ